MIEIKDLLLRFNNDLLNKELKKELIISVLHRVIGIQIKNKDIQIKNNIIYLNIKPIYKNEVLLKKENIFQELKKKLDKKAPQNII